MNRFVKSGSKLFIFAACFFISTVFFDQANLLDILIGNENSIDIEHPEEVEKTLSDSPTISNHIDFNIHRISPDTKIKHQKNTKVLTKRIIIDEDSPSTEANLFDVSILSQNFPDELSTDYSFVTITEFLYLHNKTLLI